LSVETFSIEQTGPGRLEAKGHLSFDTAIDALRSGTRLIGAAGKSCTIGLSHVATGDSAGLAVLVEWLAIARANGTSLKYESVPDQILAIAKISDVQDLLTGD
jgi:phospholipid transport system transporter-binding protein